MKPDADYIVESWKVDGQVIDSHSTSYEVTVKKNTEVSVRLVPASYKVTYKVNNEQGKLLVGKDTEEKTDGEISAAYGTVSSLLQYPINSVISKAGSLMEQKSQIRQRE